MVKTWLRRTRMAFVGALGVTILLGAPLLAQADQGKWWKPKEGDRKVERQDRGSSDRGNQSDRGAWRGRDTNDRGNWSDRRDGDQGGAWRGGDQGAWRDRVTVRDRGKWWDRGNGGQGRITYRDRRYSGRATWGGYSTWRRGPGRRDAPRIPRNPYRGGHL